ncbi:MAG TPA: D-alanyl-D-alanine carboxypeptidase [Candidatus Eisenbacteria bacterium]|nr:D-alanyl-D-alanine carboxypeptidase [Candidatus Eisenbacteria bacterium]
MAPLAVPAAKAAPFFDGGDAMAASEGARGYFASDLDSILGPDLRAAQIGLLAVSVDRGDTLVAYRDGRRLIPGSNTKLFPTGALLALHGAGAARTTTIEARGKVKRAGKKGEPPSYELRGDLTLHPCGMPDAVPLLRPGSRGLLDSLAVLLRASGLKRFEGTLYVDRTLFAAEGFPAGWAQDDLGYSYGAPLGPVLANGNAALVIATEEKGALRVQLDPPETPLTIRVGSIAIGDSGAVGWLTPRWGTGSRVLELSGMVPRGGAVKRSVAMSDPDSAAALLLLAAMRREGIELKKVSLGFLLPGRDGSGPMGPDAWRGVEPDGDRAWSGEATVAGWDSVSAGRAATVAALRSLPVGEAIGAVNARSLNIEAEGLLRLASPAGWAKSRREGIAQIYRMAAEFGIDTLDLSLVDGSGLSPQNLATPRAIVRWLASLDAAEATRGVLRGGLAVAGAPGSTLERRFVTLPAGADLRAKTGTLTNVSSLSGYLRTVEGEEIVFAMIVNAARRSVSAARDAEERLVSFLARVPKRRGPPFLPPRMAPR